MQDKLRSCMLDVELDAEQHVNKASLPEDQWHALLALRGLLAGGILLHGLQLRHGVQYGINRYKH